MKDEISVDGTMLHRRENRTVHRRGAGDLLEIGLGIALIALILPSLFSTEQNRQQTQDAASLAHDMKMAATPFASYVSHNYQALMKMTGSGGAVEIPISGSPGWNGIGDLQHSQYFPLNYSGSLPSFQRMRFAVYQVPAQNNVPAHLASMIAATGGNPMTDLQVRQAAQLLGASGGAVLRHPMRGESSNTILGAYGSWSYPAGQWNLQGLTSGHVVYSTDMNVASSGLSDFLNRYWTGNPEANRMHTWIDMNGQGLSNTLTIDGVNSNDVFIGDRSHQNNLVIRGGGQIDENRGLTFVSYSSTGDAQEGLASAQLRRDGRWLLLAGENGIVGLRGGLAKFDRIGLVGFEPDTGYPQGWAGGVHTWDVYAEGSIGIGQNGQRIVSLDNSGIIWGQKSVASARLGLMNIRMVQRDTPCNVGNEITGGADFVSMPAATIAPLNDGSGDVATCSNGVWTPLNGGLPSHMVAGGQLPYTNNTSRPVFIVASNQWWNCGKGKKDNPDWAVLVDGVQVCHEQADSASDWQSGHASCSFPLQPHSTATATGNYGCSVNTVMWTY